MCLQSKFVSDDVDDFYPLNMNDYRDQYIVSDNVLIGNDKCDEIAFDANTVTSNRT